MADAVALLVLVNAAINVRLVGGVVESYEIDGRNIRYVSLTDLFEIRRGLEREKEIESAGGLPVAYAVKDRRLAE